MSNNQKNVEYGEQVLQLVQAIVSQDEALRKTYGIDNKFRFIRERLQNLLQRLEQELHATMKKQIEEKVKKNVLSDDESLVYVYLFNAHGTVLSSWQNLLTPKVFYEYSVNRPIYMDRAHVHSLVQSKSNKAQHGFLTVAIKTVNVIQSEGLKDSLGNPLIKIKEGSLLFEKLLGFTCNDEEYILNSKNELIKKS